MVLRKRSVNNSVRYIPKSEQTGGNKLKTIKAASLPRKKNHKTIKSFLIMFQHQDSNSLMNNELLLLIKKLTGTLIEQTKTKPQETLEFKMNKQMQTFSFNPPINLPEEDKWPLAVDSSGCTNSCC